MPALPARVAVRGGFAGRRRGSRSARPSRPPLPSSARSLGDVRSVMSISRADSAARRRRRRRAAGHPVLDQAVGGHARAAPLRSAPKPTSVGIVTSTMPRPPGVIGMAARTLARPKATIKPSGRTVAPKARRKTHSEAASSSQLTTAHRMTRRRSCGSASARAAVRPGGRPRRRCGPREQLHAGHRPQGPAAGSSPLMQAMTMAANEAHEHHADDGGGDVDRAEAGGGIDTGGRSRG